MSQSDGIDSAVFRAVAAAVSIGGGRVDVTQVAVGGWPPTDGLDGFLCLLRRSHGFVDGRLRVSDRLVQHAVVGGVVTDRSSVSGRRRFTIGRRSQRNGRHRRSARIQILRQRHVDRRPGFLDGGHGIISARTVADGRVMAVMVVVGRWHVLLLAVIHLMGIQAESETIARVLHHLKRRRALFQQEKKAVSLVSQLVNAMSVDGRKQFAVFTGY